MEGGVGDEQGAELVGSVPSFTHQISLPPSFPLLLPPFTFSPFDSSPFLSFFFIKK